MRPRLSIWNIPHAFRGPVGNSTEGPCGNGRTHPRLSFRHAHHTFRGPIGSSTQGPSGPGRMCDLAHIGTPITRFVAPKGARYRAPRWMHWHGVAPPISGHTPHTFRGPQGASPRAPVGALAWRCPAHCGTPLTRIVAHRERHNVMAPDASLWIVLTC